MARRHRPTAEGSAGPRRESMWLTRCRQKGMTRRQRPSRGLALPKFATTLPQVAQVRCQHSHGAACDDPPGEGMRQLPAPTSVHRGSSSATRVALSEGGAALMRRISTTPCRGSSAASRVDARGPEAGNDSSAGQKRTRSVSIVTGSGGGPSAQNYMLIGCSQTRSHAASERTAGFTLQIRIASREK